MDVVIAVDDPRVDDVRALLEAHLAFSRAVTPPGHVHALGIDGLLDPAVTFLAPAETVCSWESERSSGWMTRTPK